MKSVHTLELLGCTVPELKKHLESQFVKGMTWDNHGEWELDHVIPISYAGDSLQEEFWQMYLMNYKNLMPLWKSDNASKSNKIKFVKNVILDRQTSV